MGSNLAKKITVADNAASIYDYMGQQCPNSMFINPVNEDEVVNIIKSCKPKHSQDCDDINNIFCRYGKMHFTNASALAVKYGTRRAKPAGSE